MQLSVVYGREIDGEPTTFGTTGYTYRQTFLLYDRKTDSVWYPLEPDRMTAVSGPLKGQSIPFLAKPALMPLREWIAEHPKTRVLVGTE